VTVLGSRPSACHFPLLRHFITPSLPIALLPYCRIALLPYYRKCLPSILKHPVPGTRHLGPNTWYRIDAEGRTPSTEDRSGGPGNGKRAQRVCILYPASIILTEHYPPPLQKTGPIGASGTQNAAQAGGIRSTFPRTNRPPGRKTR
jgi:hypothetical protein